MVSTWGDWLHVDDQAATIRARVAQGDQRQVFEALIPWQSLRRKDSDRPGGRKWIRVGVSIITGDGDRAAARELGFDVAIDGGAPWWVPIELK